MKKKTIIWTAVGAVALALVLWLVPGRSGKARIDLETAFASVMDISSSVTATGTVEPVVEVEVGTQVSGIIDKLYVDFNDEVKAGQVIAEMDKVNLQAELKSAQSQLASDRTEYEYQLKEFTRQKTLHDKELVSDSDYDLAFYNYRKAENAFQQSQASLVKVQRNLSYATITSPIDGVVINRAVEEGQTVAAGFSTPTLFTIANDLTQMQVIADVDEADIGQVLEGKRAEFTVDAYPDDIFRGEVKQVRLEATTESNVVTYEVVISAPNPELKLKPGLTANVTIFTMEEKGVLTVPTKALRFSAEPEILDRIGLGTSGESVRTDSTRTLWVKEGNVLRARIVKTGTVSGDRTSIPEGLQEGEEVAVGLSTEAAPGKTNSARSPFMPGPRGGNEEKKDSTK